MIRTLSTVIIQILFFNSLAFGFCQEQYDKEIFKLREGLKTMGTSPAKTQVFKRMSSLKAVRDVLDDIDRNNALGPATRSFSQVADVNPRTLQNIIRRANKRNDLCSNGVLLDQTEITELIKSGKLL